MDELRKKSLEEEARGKAESLKGKVKEQVGKLAGDSDTEAEGQAEQGEGKTRETIGKAGRALDDIKERAKEELDK